MSFDLGMQRFGESGEGAPKYAGVLEDMLRAAQAATPTGASGYVLEPRGRDGFDVALAAGTGTVHEDHAAFQLQELREPDLRVIHAIAVAGDMTVIVEGGQYKAILTDPQQRRRLPKDWVGDDEPTPLAVNAKQLGQLLRSAFDAREAYRQKVMRLYDQLSEGPIHPTPWSSIDDRERIVYMQAFQKEMPLGHQRRVFRFYTQECVARDVVLPTAGSMGGFGWSVRIPSGEVFYGFTAKGDHDGWMRVLKSFAAAEDRLIGTIEGGGSGSECFVTSDGRSFALRECTCRVLTED